MSPELLRWHIKDAVEYAIARLEEDEKRRGYDMPSAMLSSWRSVLEQLGGRNQR